MGAGCSVMSTQRTGCWDSWRQLQTGLGAARRRRWYRGHRGIEASRHQGTEAKAAAGVHGHSHGQTYCSGIAATLAIQAARSTRDAVEEPFVVKQTAI
jgi:hypothetical protein